MGGCFISERLFEVTWVRCNYDYWSKAKSERKSEIDLKFVSFSFTSFLLFFRALDWSLGAYGNFF